jgi:hypothetical protein
MASIGVGIEAGEFSPESSPAWAVWTAVWDWSPQLWQRGFVGLAHGTAHKLMDGGVEPDSRFVEVAKLSAGRTASLDFVSTLARSPEALPVLILPKRCLPGR